MELEMPSMALIQNADDAFKATLHPKATMELLAPVGGWEQLHAALLFGADAVYLATDQFGMRARAKNFALDELPAVVECVHRAGAKVYLACNTLMFPADLKHLPGFFTQVQEAGVDALIIGDLGAFRLARSHAPEVELHVSTQASVANSEAARQWYELGAKRIVCARELSLDDIRSLRKETPLDLEIEVFAHGAMCMAVSGRCLISSYLTGRSGNRGNCTQPCRWKYTLEEEKRPGEHFPIAENGRGTFIMNARDLNMLEHVSDLALAGVDAIKIEGRNKKAFYVATVVNAYRRVLDGEPAHRVISELDTISHRPYSTGFFFGEAEQAPDYEGYEQTCIHVADVVESDGSTLLLRCRNGFDEGELLEVLEPGQRDREVMVKNLTWLPDATEDNPLPAPLAVPRANRACQYYRVDSALNIPSGSFLRRREFRRSARHGS